MKVIVVGGVAAGASAAARLRRLDEKAEIIIFEQGEHVSFSNCGLPYHLGGTIPDADDLVLMTPRAFKARHNIEVRVNSRVTAIDRKAKTVTVQPKEGPAYTERYDKLILAPGAAPIVPGSIPGVRSPHVFTLRNVTDVKAIKAYIDEQGVTRAAVVGGGFIGVEVAENLACAGLLVTLVEGADQVLAPFDYDMAQILHKELMDNGVQVELNSLLAAVHPDRITVTRNGEAFDLPAQMVVLAIGVSPETALAKDAGLAIGETRGIKVDANWRTEDEDVYAVGDAVESFDRLARRPGRLALAGPAQRQARAAADHICGRPADTRGFIGSACVRVFDQNAAATGLSEKAACKAGIPCRSVLLYPTDKVGLMPDAAWMAFKLVFETPTGRILGAQAIGRGDAVRRIDVIATLISMNGTLADLKELELCYSPVYGTAKDVVNLAALVGLNVLEGRVKQVPVTAVRRLVEQGACIIDVREEREFNAGHLKGAVNIPLSRFRERMNEVPKDVPVYLHCRTSQRSYYALCELLGNGYTNVYNISGSFLGICLYEYFNDRTLGREPIVTAYNFN